MSPPRHAPPPAQQNNSLIRGIECLQTLISRRQPIGSSEMARRLHIQQSTASRLLGTLACIGMAERGADGKYRPGPGVHVLAAQSLRGSPLLAVGLPHLEALRRAFSVVSLGVLWGHQVCYLYHARPEVDSPLGSHQLAAAHNSSIGIWCASRLASDALEEIGRALQHEKKTSTEPFEEAVASARRTGHAQLSFGGRITSLAVGVGDPDVAALAVSGRFKPEMIPVHLEKIRAAAAAITAGLLRSVAVPTAIPEDYLPAPRPS